MGEFHTRFTWKVWVIILVVLAVILFLLILIPNLYSRSPSPTEDSKRNIQLNNTQNSTNSQGKRQNTDQGTNISRQTWNVYDADFFRLSYPENWKVNAAPIPGSGFSWIFEPSQITSLRLRVEIQITFNPQITVESLQNIFIKSELKRKQVLIGSMQADQFSGVFGEIQEKALIFEYNGRVFKIQSQYISKTQNSEIERTIDMIVSSIKLK